MHSYLHWHAYAWFVFHHIWFGCSLRNWIYCVSCLQRSVLAFVAHRWQATFWQIRFRERDLRWPVGFRERYLGQSSVDDMRMRCVSLFSFLYLCATCAAMELPPDDSGPCITGPVKQGQSMFCHWPTKWFQTRRHHVASGWMYYMKISFLVFNPIFTATIVSPKSFSDKVILTLGCLFV